MKKLFIAILMAMPLIASAQDNTWERIEQAQVVKDNPDAKYLVDGAVPVIDGVVCWQTTINAPGKTAKQIYDILYKQMDKMVNEPNQIANSAIVQDDKDKHELGAIFHEWLVFKNSTLSLDRTQLNFQLLVKYADGKADVKITHITYDYDLERKPVHYKAEEWITDKYAVNKKHTKLYPISAKFRRKTIDRKDFIFSKFNSLLNDK
jgi:colicin import membrane protein